MITTRDFNFALSMEGDTAIVTGQLCLTESLTFNVMTLNFGADEHEAQRRTTEAAQKARNLLAGQLWTRTYGEIHQALLGIQQAAREGGDLRTLGLIADALELLKPRPAVPTPAPSPQPPLTIEP